MNINLTKVVCFILYSYMLIMFLALQLSVKVTYVHLGGEMIIIQLLEFDSVCQIGGFSDMLYMQKYIDNLSKHQ